MGRLKDPPQLPQIVQLANEDRINADGTAIIIDEEYREKYNQTLNQPISEGDYYLVESLT